MASKSSEMMHSLTDPTGNEITEPLNVKHEYFREFQHRLTKRGIRPELQDYEKIQNKLCHTRLRESEKVISPHFTFDEIKCAVQELKGGQCSDPKGLIREVFKNAGDGPLLSILAMADFIKSSKAFLQKWSELWIKTLKKKKGSFKSLKSCRGVLIVPIISIIFEKLLKNRITLVLKQNMSNFQNGGSKGKGVVDNLFLLRALIDHSKYMGKQLWLTFYDTEKCFDSSCIEDCINSLWDNGVRDDTLSLIYNLNVKANITIKTPFGDTQVLPLENLVKQGTVLGLVLNNRSLGRVCKGSLGYHIGSVEIKSMEFVDDIADPNSDEVSTKFSNRIVEQIQFEKRLTLSAEKCVIENQ